MIPILRKRAASLALLSVLLFSLAAPYMLPLNPDSSVFRCGAYAAILVAGCWLPVRHALERASLRRLVCGLVFGCLLALGLSLRAEYFVYGTLLPGTGSFLRRIAVPLMAAPLMGGLAVRACAVVFPDASASCAHTFSPQEPCRVHMPVRHPAVCALLSVLAMFLVSPYLNPISPETPVFRRAMLPILLTLGCGFSVYHALCRCSPSELLCGGVFAIIFLVCLSFGAELTVYEKFLPGTVSMLRRIAVPLLAAPAIGAMTANFLAFCPECKSSLRFKLPYCCFFLLFALCYGALLLAFYPGVISYDFPHEIRQFTTGVYEAAHPVFHTLFLGFLYQAGETLFGSMNAGAASYSAVQLLLMALIFAYVCTFAQKRLPLPAVLLLAALFAFLPLHGILAISTAKDPLFAGLCVMLCLFIWEAAENPGAFTRPHAFRFALCCLGTALLRHNALFAFLPACLALVLIHKKRAALLCVAVTLALCFALPHGLEMLVHATTTPGSELMSVPCQQLMRTAEKAPLSDDEKTELSAWFSDATHRYRPHCADPAKGGNFDFIRYQLHPEEYIEIYLRYARRFPVLYLEAFLENCAGLWNPNDVSHAKAMTSENYEYSYLNTVYDYDPEQYDLQPVSLLPQLRRVIYESTHHARHQNFMFLSALFSPAFHSFSMLLCCLMLALRKRRRFIWAFGPLWGIWTSLLFSAGIFVRYAYPFMAAAPVLLLLTLFLRPESEA